MCDSMALTVGKAMIAAHALYMSKNWAPERINNIKNLRTADSSTSIGASFSAKISRSLVYCAFGSPQRVGQALFSSDVSSKSAADTVVLDIGVEDMDESEWRSRAK